jgi:hypothetical protein
MAIKLDELTGWKRIPSGQVLNLSSELKDPRKVRVHFNCEDRTWVYARYGGNTGDPQYIATTGPGCETLEFFVGGDVELSFVADKEGLAQIWVQTAELEPNVSANPNAVSFTETVLRRARNPELELMQALARQNQDRMNAVLQQQTAVLRELQEERKKLVSEKPIEPVAASNGDKPQGGSGTGSQGDGGVASGGTGGGAAA